MRVYQFRHDRVTKKRYNTGTGETPWQGPARWGDPSIYAGLPLRSKGATALPVNPDGRNHHHQTIAITGV